MNKFDLIRTQINIPKYNLKVLDMDLQELENKLYDTILDNVVQSLKDMDENVPDEVLRAFAVTYLKFTIESEYDLRTNQYEVVCIPSWKDSDEIERDSEEMKLLEEYNFKILE